MNIYHLDATILKSSEHSDKWLAGDFHDCMAYLEKHLAYRPDWEDGENWCRFYLHDKLAGMLCAKIPFMISNSDAALEFLPFYLEVIMIDDFYNDKITLSKPLQDFIEPMSPELECPAFIQDFYVATV